MTVNLKELKKPFHPSQVTWKPQATSEDRTKAMAIAYGDVRAYQERLDEVCGMEWEVSYTPWGDRIICNLTIQGVSRSSTGEPDSQNVRSEVAGTAAEAQAFKRACAMFGLGRYLYKMPRMWVEYDSQSRSFTDKARARLDQVVAQHYKRYIETNDVDAEPQEPAETTQAAQDAHEGSNGNKTIKTLSAPRTGASVQTKNEEFETAGRQHYGKHWEAERKRNIERLTNGRTSIASELTQDELQRLIDGIKSLMEKVKVAA